MIPGTYKRWYIYNAINQLERKKKQPILIHAVNHWARHEFSNVRY
jgi:hypothetical protein